jgi:hypothetical protein
MRSKIHHALPLVLVSLLLSLMLHSCQAFEQPPEGVLTPQELIFTSAAETLVAGLTPALTSTPPVETRPSPSDGISPTPVMEVAPLPGATLEPSPNASPTSTSAPAPTPTALETILPSPTAAAELPTATDLPTTTPLATVLPSPTSVTPAPTATDLPSLTPAATATPPLVLVFEDDFSTRTGWHTETRPGFEMFYQASGYRIRNRNTQANVSSIRTFDHYDIRVEAGAAMVSGPTGAYYGVICRWQNVHNLYAFVIGSEGYHAIIKIQNRELSFLKEGRMVNGVIQPLGGINRITGICEGSSLALDVNGHRLLETEDITFGSGYVGLLVGNQDQPGSLVHFDNFTLFAP